MAKLVWVPGDLGKRFLTGVQAQLVPCQQAPGVTVAPAEADLFHCLPWEVLQDAKKGLQKRVPGQGGHRHPSREGAGWHEPRWSNGELPKSQSPSETLVRAVPLYAMSNGPAMSLQSLQLISRRCSWSTPNIQALGRALAPALAQYPLQMSTHGSGPGGRTHQRAPLTAGTANGPPRGFTGTAR